MRANGVDERFCTGDAAPYDKFLAWARTVPYTLRNPLYHWTHLELQRYFGIGELLDERSARSVWERANEKLAGADLTARGILRRFRVTALCTTDDPADDLRHHQAIAASGFPVAVYPAFRPDRVFEVHLPERWNAWLGRLEGAANREIRNLNALLDALQTRHDYFHSLGCRLSDHGLNSCPAEKCTESEAAAIFVMDRGLQALLGFAPANVQLLPNVDTYISYFTGMILGFGIAFELPLVIVMLNVVGVLTHERFRKWRRLMIFLVFLICGIVNPSPDPYTMLILGGLAVVLVELAEVFVYFNDKRRARRNPNPYEGLADDELSPIEEPEPVDADTSN